VQGALSSATKGARYRELLMPNCDFYAAGDDFRIVLDFVFDQPGWMLVELASMPDQPLRSFESTRAVLDAYDLEQSDALLHLYAPELGGGIFERPITFRPGAVGAAKGRTSSEGWGLIQLYLSGGRDGLIRPSHTNHNSETRARSWEPMYPDLGPVGAWDWPEVSRASGRLNRHIRRSAVQKSGSRVILPEAAARAAQGAELLLNMGSSPLGARAAVDA
jgi:hypothetical protein